MTVLASKILRIFLGVLLAISALLMILFFVNVVSVDMVIYWGYFLLIFTAVIVILFPIVFLIMNPKNSIKIFISLGVMVVIAIIAYSLSQNNFTELQLEELETTADTVKYVGAGLIFTYILASLAVLSIIYASISRIFK
ncbi:MAG: hypothetical protein KAR09_02185 [Bacteroidales bacterium]|nr:hypothetical protein [Bacteroidota bacterium]MCK5078720.1 hypothetical protein [Bacteroidales bacterium]MCK5338448.1 hypothetical protein [Bacteroidales bacterium]MCK5765302.1 hypothetical protein [Bacteroidales bacterium]RLD34703.1 MAG: hypothetical protein DRI83_07690 [Bacteroidota bacterium]